jgi:hypothetical protein
LAQCDAAEEMNPELVALAKRLHRRNPKTGQRLSLRAIAAELASQGLVNMHGPSLCRGVDTGDGAGLMRPPVRHPIVNGAASPQSSNQF